MLRITLEVLKDKKIENEKMKIIYRDEYNKNNSIYYMSDGKTMRPTYISKIFRKLVKKHSFRTYTFHDLRHTHASVFTTYKWC